MRHAGSDTEELAQPKHGRLGAVRYAVMLVLPLLSISGCMTGGLDFGLGGQPDRSIISGSVPVATDASIISNAVAEAEIQPSLLQDVPWSNGTTGNFGTISYIREKSSVGKICRDFIVSKQSYDGISQFTGEICRKRLGKSWSIKALNEQT